MSATDKVQLLSTQLKILKECAVRHFRLPSFHKKCPLKSFDYFVRECADMDEKTTPEMQAHILREIQPCTQVFTAIPSNQNTKIFPDLHHVTRKFIHYRVSPTDNGSIIHTPPPTMIEIAQNRCTIKKLGLGLPKMKYTVKQLLELFEPKILLCTLPYGALTERLCSNTVCFCLNMSMQCGNTTKTGRFDAYYQFLIERRQVYLQRLFSAFSGHPRGDNPLINLITQAHPRAFDSSGFSFQGCIQWMWTINPQNIAEACTVTKSVSTPGMYNRNGIGYHQTDWFHDIELFQCNKYLSKKKKHCLN
jgi:hypothetical protein